MAALGRFFRFVWRWIGRISRGTALISLLLFPVLWIRSYWIWDVIQYPRQVVEDVDPTTSEDFFYDIRFISVRGWIGVYVDRTSYGKISPRPSREKVDDYLRQVTAKNHPSWDRIEGGTLPSMNPAFYAWNREHPNVPVNWEHDHSFTGLPHESVTAGVADWLLFVFLSGWLAWCWRRLATKLFKRNGRRGVCSSCNYDLRAHQPGDKCPECGTIIFGTKEIP